MFPSYYVGLSGCKIAVFNFWNFVFFVGFFSFEEEKIFILIIPMFGEWGYFLKLFKALREVVKKNKKTFRMDLVQLT